MTIHTIEQSRYIITENFKLFEKILNNPKMKNISELKDFLNNIINHLENSDTELSKLVNKNIQNIIKEIAEDKQENIRETIIEEKNVLKFIEKTQYNNIKDMTQNIYEYFNTYPTKERISFPDGTIINMTPDEPAVDENFKILPMIDGIPQGEEATRIITQNTDTGVIIASPPGVLRSYFITRYGSPKVYGSVFNKYQEFRKIVGIDFSNNCFLKDFGCEGVVQPIISMDLDSELMCCKKHHSFNYHLLNMNIAMISDVGQFYDDRVLRYLTSKNQMNKINLIKKIKILLNLANNGRLKNRQLDSDFKLYGIHYYGQSSLTHKKKIYGWALVYYSIERERKRLCHIYLDELTDDVKVLCALSLFAKEVILSKYANDLEPIDNFIKDKNKKNYDNIKKCMNNAYKMDMIDVIYNKLVV